jgi:cytoskeletal protein CcmA (bactofilin family)
MAWSWLENKGETAEWTGFLEPGVKFEGTLETKGMFRIDSQMKGAIVSREVLILGEHAEVEGEILGNQVLISGKFDGTIRASSRVEIQAKAIVRGKIHAPCVIIEPEAAFDGECHVVISTEPASSISIPVRSAIGQSVSPNKTSA